MVYRGRPGRRKGFDVIDQVSDFSSSSLFKFVLRTSPPSRLKKKKVPELVGIFTFVDDFYLKIAVDETRIFLGLSFVGCEFRSSSRSI